MNKIILTALVLTFVGGTAAYATEGSVSGSAGVKVQTGIKPEWKHEMKEARSEGKTEIKDLRTEGKAEFEAKKKAFEEEMKKKREALQELLKGKKDALKLEIDKIKKEHANVRKGYVENKLRQVVKVIEARQAKITEAIARLEKNDVNTDDAEKEVVASKASLKLAVEALDKMAKIAVETEDKTKIEEARKYAKEAETQLKASREHLLTAIKELKEAVEAKKSVEAEVDVEATVSNQ